MSIKMKNRFDELQASLALYKPYDIFTIDSEGKTTLTSRCVSQIIEILNFDRNQINAMGQLELEFWYQWACKIKSIYLEMCCNAPKDKQPRKFPEVDALIEKLVNEINKRYKLHNVRERHDSEFVSWMLRNVK